MNTVTTGSPPSSLAPAFATAVPGILLIPALTMSVGWGLRGFIGGGSLGAMIPGALVALALCHCLRVPSAVAGRIAAFGAIGVGFGGQETYGQTVGLVVNGGELFWRSVVGLGVKGAVWGFLGGAVLGVSFLRDLSRRTLFVALPLLVAGTWLGWRFIDQPKLIYFSNLLDRPREEVWAGLLMGGFGFLGWMIYVLRDRARVPVVFALLGLVGGGIGFAFGGVSFAAGKAWGGTVELYPGWKQMEFTFGLCFGAALGLAAYWLRHDIAAATRTMTPPTPARGWPMVAAVVGSVAFGAAAIWGSSALPVRFSYTVAGAALLGLVYMSERAAWQIAITITAGAFLLYVGKFFTLNHPGFHPAVATTIALVLTALLSAWIAVRQASGREMATWALRVLLWTSVGAGVAHAGWHREISPALVMVVSVFVVGAIIITRGTRARQ